MSLHVRVEKEFVYEFLNENGDVLFVRVTSEHDPLGLETLADICLYHTEETGVEVEEIRKQIRYVPYYSDTRDHW